MNETVFRVYFVCKQIAKGWWCEGMIASATKLMLLSFMYRLLFLSVSPLLRVFYLRFYVYVHHRIYTICTSIGMFFYCSLTEYPFSTQWFLMYVCEWRIFIGGKGKKQLYCIHEAEAPKKYWCFHFLLRIDKWKIAENGTVNICFVWYSFIDPFDSCIPCAEYLSRLMLQIDVVRNTFLHLNMCRR